MRPPITLAFCFASLALVPMTSLAQDAGGSFGERDSFAFTVENLLGIVTTSVGQGDESSSVDTLGMLPPYWGDVGLFSMSPNGFNWGALVGFEHLAVTDGADVTLLKLRPRLGWATSKNQTLGAWLRGGPSLMMAHSGAEDGGDAQTSELFALGFEGYVVITPAEHVGILFGPHADFHLVGHASEGDDPTYSSYGLSFGLMGEIW